MVDFPNLILAIVVVLIALCLISPATVGVQGQPIIDLKPDSNESLLPPINQILPIAHDCYQESATTKTEGDGTCGLTYTGTYIFSDDRYFYANYIKPSAVDSAEWQISINRINDGTPTNITIPTQCLRDTVELRAPSSDYMPRTASLDCYDGSTWVSISPEYAQNDGSCGGTHMTQNTPPYAVDGNWSLVFGDAGHSNCVGYGWSGVDLSTPYSPYAPGPIIYEEAIWWHTK